jgi:hypothetical protein
MELKPPRRPGRFWSHAHYLLRVLGATGALAVGVGLVLARGTPLLTYAGAEAAVKDLAEGDVTGLSVPAWMLLCGGAAVLLALLVELIGALGFAAGRRNALGLSSAVQVVLATVLLVGVNVWSAGLDVDLFGHKVEVRQHALKLDWTRDKQFTLPAEVREQLAQMKDDTTIVVLLRHETRGVRSDQRDEYDVAAEREVVAKVRDLVALFRDAGPHFDVHVLDVKDDGFADQLSALTADAPELRKSIDATSENAVFFQGRRRRPDGRTEEVVQALSFDNFYRLDKTASRQADGGRGNLVLRAQGADGSGRGVEAVARKVLNLGERKPVVGIAVIHEYLTTQGTETYGLGGLRKALEANGLEVRDIVYRAEARDWSPAVDTPEAGKLAELEEELDAMDELIGPNEAPERVFILSPLYASALGQLVSPAPCGPLAAVSQVHVGLKAPAWSPSAAVAEARHNLAFWRAQREQVLRELSALDVDELAEQNRMTDLKAKMAARLAECDLLVVVKPTLRDVLNVNFNLPLWLHGMDRALTQAVRDAVKKGKPLLLCVGPANLPPRRPGQARQVPEGESQTDGLDDLLADLGVRLSPQTVLFDVENRAFGAVRAGALTAGTGIVVPPLRTDAAAGDGLPPGLGRLAFPRPPHPLRVALDVAGRALGRPLDLRFRHPRPVYYDPPRALTPGPTAASLCGLGGADAGPWLAASLLAADDALAPVYDPVILLTSEESWNEDQPFIVGRKVPTPRLSSPGDPLAGTLDEHRRGPFPVGLALEVRPPASWYAAGEKRPQEVRAAVIGQAWFLVGPELTPAKERLAADVCNWLVGRDDALPGEGTAWQLPRVELAHEDLWLWGARVGLPALFAWLGFVVLLARRLR